MGQKDADDKIMSLKEAIRRYVSDGNTITLGGFCGRNAQAAAYEIIRQRKRNLIFVDDSPTDQLDMLIGSGCIDKVEIAWHGGLITLPPNFRRAVEQEIPKRIEIEDYSNFAMSLRFLAGALDIPFMPVKSLLGSDIPRYNKKIKIVKDPYSKEPLALVPAARPDVAIIHVQRADKKGNSQIWGGLGNDENKARASKHTIITCEEIVPEEEIRRIPNMTIIPFYCVDAVVEVPYGSHPWFCFGYYYGDLPFRIKYFVSSRTYDGFTKWINEWILGCENHFEYCNKLGWERLYKLSRMERLIAKIPI
ncbi:MAG: CoA-transferase [Candidatus Micrarchaeia archaeon]